MSNDSSNTKIEKNNGNKTIKKKRRWLRLFLELLVILALVFAIRAWQQRDMVSGVAPDFQGVLLNGEMVSLENYRGKPLLLHFWASWCPFCKFEESSINDLNENWQVLTVAYQSGDKAEVIEHMQQRNIENWPTVIDSDNRLAERFGVKGVPTTYILDGNGNIRFTEVGLTSGWGLKARLWWAENIKTSQKNKLSTAQK